MIEQEITEQVRERIKEDIRMMNLGVWIHNKTIPLVEEFKDEWNGKTGLRKNGQPLKKLKDFLDNLFSYFIPKRKAQYMFHYYVSVSEYSVAVYVRIHNLETKNTHEETIYIGSFKGSFSDGYEKKILEIKTLQEKEMYGTYTLMTDIEECMRVRNKYVQKLDTIPYKLKEYVR